MTTNKKEEIVIPSTILTKENWWYYFIETENCIFKGQDLNLLMHYWSETSSHWDGKVINVGRVG